MSTLQELFAEIDRDHSLGLCTNASEIDVFEKRLGYQLPSDLKAFYRRYKSVRLFDSGYGASYRFVPISEIHPTRIDVYSKDTDEWGPSTWLTICDVLDGNYIAIDVASRVGKEYNYIDCFHETFARPGRSRIIAKSFTELLERALRGGAQTPYYVQKGFVGYGDGRHLTAENAAIRIGDPGVSNRGWLVDFAVKGTVHHKFFSDKEYGGKEGAFEAVKRYIEEASLDRFREENWL